MIVDRIDNEDDGDDGDDVRDKTIIKVNQKKTKLSPDNGSVGSQQAQLQTKRIRRQQRGKESHARLEVTIQITKKALKCTTETTNTCKVCAKFILSR